MSKAIYKGSEKPYSQNNGNTHHRNVYTTSTSPSGTKYNIPCKYHQMGVCKLGDQCRFWHDKSVPHKNFHKYENDYEYEEEIDEEEEEDNEEYEEADDYDEEEEGYNGSQISRNSHYNNNYYHQQQQQHNNNHNNSHYSSHHHYYSHQGNNNQQYNNYSNSHANYGGNGSTEGDEYDYFQLQPSLFSIQSIKEQFDAVSLNLLNMKPLLHIIVLYATDTRVRKYAEEVCNLFLKYGIHVFLQIEVQYHQPIKPANLGEIITKSGAEFLVVIGDRNMKNKTCQAKKGGKLIEVPNEERAKQILSEWEKNPKNLSTKVGNLSGNISDISDDQIADIFELFTGIRGIKHKLSSLSEDVNTLQSWKSPIALQGDVLGDHVCLTDEKMLSKLTSCQTDAIKFHRMLMSKASMIQSINIDEVNSANSPTGILINSTNVEQIGITKSLKESLVQLFNSIMKQFENLGNSLSEVAGKSSLWEAYKSELKSKKQSKDKKNIQNSNNSNHNNSSNSSVNNLKQNSNNYAKTQATSNQSIPKDNDSWNCKKCTYYNRNSFTNCEICGANKRDEGEWSVTSKKKRKKLPNEVSNTQPRMIIQPQTSYSQTTAKNAALSRNQNMKRASNSDVKTSMPQVIQPTAVIPSKRTPPAPSYWQIPQTQGSTSTNQTVTIMSRESQRQTNTSISPSQKISSIDNNKDFPNLSSITILSRKNNSNNHISKSSTSSENSQYINQISNFDCVQSETNEQNPNVWNTFSHSLSQSLPNSYHHPSFTNGKMASYQNHNNYTSNGVDTVGFHLPNDLWLGSGEFQEGFNEQTELYGGYDFGNNHNIWNDETTENQDPIFASMSSSSSSSSNTNISYASFAFGGSGSGGSNSLPTHLYHAFNGIHPNPADSAPHSNDAVNHGITTDSTKEKNKEPSSRNEPSIPSPSQKKSTRPNIVNQPCVICGKESMFECNFCAGLRKKGIPIQSTYFCSPEHQTLAWKEHTLVHEKHSPSSLKNQTHR